MSRNAFDAIERQYNEAEDYRATVKQERALDLAEKRIAELDALLDAARKEQQK